MQIAKIVPKVKTTREGVFDYDIPPEFLPQIKIGILVQVPFHGRKVEGIITEIKRSSKIENLKKIIKIIDPNPVIDDIHLKLAQWMSNYYLEPFSKTIFSNTIPPAIRMIKKDGIDSKVIDNKTIDNHKPQNFLVISDFQNRIKFYLKKINETLKQKKQIIILIPDLSNIQYFKKYLPKDTAIFHANMTRTERFILWQNILEGKSPIVLGSISALFAPFKNLGLVIIDQEEAESYKNDRSPRFHGLRTAQQLAKLTNANLIIGSVAPRLETYFQASHEKYQILSVKNPKIPNISIVDMNSEKEILSFPLKEKIEKYLKLKQKIILTLNRKDEKGRFICSDCGYKNIFPIPKTCPKCQSINLKQFGISVGRLKKIVEKNYPEAKVAICADEKNYNFLPQKWDIIIATSFILKFSLPKIELIGIMDADQGLNLPDFRINEKTFNNLYKFIKIGTNAIIQTHNPGNNIVTAVADFSYNKFIRSEIELRKKTNFPPFCRLISLIYKNPDEEKAKSESQKVYRKIKEMVLENFEILGPSPAFFGKIRNYFRYQIILKVPINDIIPSSIKDMLINLHDWTINIDPIELL